jgi:hypothetical protein
MAIPLSGVPEDASQPTNTGPKKLPMLPTELMNARPDANAAFDVPFSSAEGIGQNGP